MARRIDSFAIRLAALIIVMAWSLYIMDNLIMGIMLGLIIFLMFNIIYAFIIKRIKPYSASQLAFYLAMQDNLSEIIAGLLPEGLDYKIEGNTISTNNGEFIYIALSFSNFSLNDIIKAIRAAKSKNANQLTVVANEIDRRIYSVIVRSDITVNIVNSRQLLKLMMKQGKLPKLTNSVKRNITLREIFSKQAAGRFILSGAVIGLMSIFMPIKLYYLIISGICFVMGIICLIQPKEKISEKSALK